MATATTPYLTGNILDRSQIGNFIPNAWTGEIRYYRDRNFFASSITNTMNVMGKQGDTYKIPLVGRLSDSDRIPGVPVEVQAETPGQYTVTVDKDRHVSFSIDDVAHVQSQYKLMKPYTKEAGYGLARGLDNFVLGLRGAVPTSQQIFRSTGTGFGTAAGLPAPLDESTLYTAMLLLMNNDVPIEECAWLISPKQLVDLINLDVIKSKDYDIASLSLGKFKQGLVGTVFNLPCYVTTQITNNSLTGYIAKEGATGAPTPGVVGSEFNPTQNSLVGSGLPRGQTGSETENPFMTGMLVHPEWAVILKQMDVTSTSSFENSLQVNLVVNRHLFGMKLYRDDHCVLFHSEGNS